MTFEAETHTYSIDGSSEGVTSVTTLLEDYFPKLDPDTLIEKYYNRWQQHQLNKFYGKSREEIKEMWEVDGKKAAAESPLLHAAIEAYYKKREISYDQESVECKYFLSFEEEHLLKLQVHRTEMVLWSSDHKQGVSIGLVVKNADGTFSLYDWKRTKKAIWKEERHCNRYGSGPLSKLPDNSYHKYCTQLNLYRELMERHYGYKISSMHVVRIHPNAKQFEVVEVERMEKEASDLLNLRHLKDVAKDEEASLVEKFDALHVL